MCGIFGIQLNENQTIDRQIIKNMGLSIEYRGPDEHGIYFAPNVAIGNQRLSIIDLEGGHQPMVSENESVAVVQNGEIFNFVELRKELLKKGYPLKTHSDTEVILGLYETEGPGFAKLLNGMFAIAVVDRRDNSLHLYRDRLGEKPLYVAEAKNALIFASEIKAILRYCSFKEVDQHSLGVLLQLGFLPPPFTLFKGIRQLMPGYHLWMRDGVVKEEAFWALSDFGENNSMSEEDAIEGIQSLFKEAVKIRLRSDVPFGAFLSGGIDSSYTVSQMGSFMNRPVETFNISFPKTNFDEGNFARMSAERFKTNHHTISVDKSLLHLWPKFIYHCDHPHADISFMPTYKVAEFARKHVKMVLTGDGADELYAGYVKYFSLNKFSPSSPKEMTELYLKDHQIFSLDALSTKFRGNKETLSSHILKQSKSLAHLSTANQYLGLDCLNLLPGNNLVKPDRMGMANSLESRQPFLDHRFVEHSLQVPGAMKLRNNETKYILKKATVGMIGDEATYRKKHMFTVPVTDWSSNGLFKIGRCFLSPKGSFASQLIGNQKITQMLEEHAKDPQKHLKKLRLLISTEIWNELFIKDSSLERLERRFSELTL